jgi:hypothetical protein
MLQKTSEYERYHPGMTVCAYPLCAMELDGYAPCSVGHCVEGYESYWQEARWRCGKCGNEISTSPGFSSEFALCPCDSAGVPMQLVRISTMRLSE